MTPPMTETRDAVARIAEDALNARRKKAGWPPTKLSQMQADDRERWIADTASTLEALRPGSRFTVDGVECVVVAPTRLAQAMPRIAGIIEEWLFSNKLSKKKAAEAMLSACEEN